MLSDAEGPFGSPTGDSRRSMITEEAREIFAVVFGVTGREALEPAVEMLGVLLRRHSSAAEVETGFVD